MVDFLEERDCGAELGRKEGSNTGERRELSLPLGKRSGGEAGARKTRGWMR